MRPRIISIISLIGLLILSSIAGAAVPLSVTYQGRLTSNTGGPVEDGEYAIIFSIWNSETEGDMLWGNDIGVTVVNGLFSVELGPLPDDLFSSGAERWLGINAGSDELEPRIRLVSVPYAFHAHSADTAYFVPEMVDCGWIRDSRGVKLKIPNDSVGVGTASPSAKLDVEGDIKASDSLAARYLRIGSTSEDGSITLYGDNTSDKALKLSESSLGGGGQLTLYEPDGSTYAHLLQPDVNGGGFMAMDAGSTTASIVFDGNNIGSKNPKVSLVGVDRSAVFDMNSAGDDAVILPFSSINCLEIWDEAGVANTVLSSAESFSSTETILTRRMWFPESGYVVVTGTVAFTYTHSSGTTDQVRFGISQTQGSFPVDQFNYRNCPSSWPSGSRMDVMTVHDYYMVSQGDNYFYLLGEFLGNGSATAVQANLTVMYFRTWRGYIEFKDGVEGDNPEQDAIDQMITERIEAEKDAMRIEFEAKLEAIREEMRKQLGDK